MVTGNFPTPSVERIREHILLIKLADSSAVLKIKRIYEPPVPEDGERILIDRLWPRGVSKEKAKLDVWMKEIAPTDELRKWFNHEESKWDEFRKRYFRELNRNTGMVGVLREKSKQHTVTLLYSAQARWNNALALKEYLEDCK